MSIESRRPTQPPPYEHDPHASTGERFHSPKSQEIIEPPLVLRDITMQEIFDRFDTHWNAETVRVNIAGDGDSIDIPDAWHGAKKYGRPNKGDAEVLFGPLLVESIEGTKLPADRFVEGLKALNFTCEDGYGKELTDAQAVAAISSDASCQTLSGEEEIPVMRAIKNDAQGKIIIEIRNGSMSPVMRELTTIGNDPVIDADKKARYRKAVSDCLGGFFTKGATAVRKRLRLYEYKRLTRFDDCLASGATIFGDQEVDDLMGRTRKQTLEEIRVAVASTQGITMAVKRALDRQVPTLIRVGALAYGLGSKAIGTNYLINTQPEMAALGRFTVGDMGDKLSTGREGRINPHVRIYGAGKNETRIYLGGGLAMLELWEDKIREKNKEPDAVVCVLQASRINPPPEQDGEIHDWGVLLKGKKLPFYDPTI